MTLKKLVNDVGNSGREKKNDKRDWWVCGLVLRIEWLNL
jgi:hypothetical protein